VIAIETNRNLWGWMLAGVDLPSRGGTRRDTLVCRCVPPSAACRAVNLWRLVRWSFAQASAPINGSRSAYWHTVADVGAGAII